MHILAIRARNVLGTPRAFLGISILFIAIIGSLSSLSASAQQSPAPLYWTIREDAIFSSQWRLNRADGATVAVLPGRALVAMLEAERRIASQYQIDPRLLITNTPGLNAFATEANGQTIVVVYADIVPIIGDDVDIWAALFGHEFAHLYHHHITAKETRAAVLDFFAAVLNAYEHQKGRDRSDLVNFGAEFVKNTFSRQQEREADETGVRFMANAGFDPQGAVRLQQLLISNIGSSGIFSFLSTHPSGEARIQDIRNVITSLPASTTALVADFSRQDFKQWMILCSTEAREGNQAPTVGTVQQCLQKHNAEFAQRYGLCAADLNARGTTWSFDTLLTCAAQSPQLHTFTYDVWAQYCIASSLAQGKAGLVNAEPTQQCIWEGDAQMAFRGTLCESEAIAMRLPSDKIRAHVRTCAAETSDEVKRFTSDNWKLACDRMGAFRANADADKSKISQDCLAQGPVAVAASSPINGALSPSEIYDQVTLAWRNHSALPPTSQGPTVGECDRLAANESFPGVKKVYVGFIEAPAAENACLDAIKSAQDPSRFQVNLAHVYFQQGRYADAYRLAKETANKNALNSNELLAIMFSAGLGVPRSPEKVIPLLLSEVKRGSVTAIADLGVRLSTGQDVEKSPDIAFKLLRLAADNGSAAAATEVANAYLSGSGTPVDVPRALEIVRTVSDDYPPALNTLSRALRATPGANPDEIRGAQSRLFDQTGHYAALGSLPAKMRLGLMYTNGFGVAPDKEKGFALLMEAEQSGYPPAALWVAYGYLNGTGTAPDREKAIESFRRAAAGGSAEAEIQLAKLTNAAG